MRLVLLNSIVMIFELEVEGRHNGMALGLSQDPGLSFTTVLGSVLVQLFNGFQWISRDLG